MTTVALPGTRVESAPRGTAPARHQAQAAILLLTIRLIRRGALLLVLAVAGYVAVEALSYVATYPDEASRIHLETFQDNPAARMLQGIPHGVRTTGGFVAWDGGWMIALIIALWAALTTVRLLRGDEEDGRAELLLAGPIVAQRAVALQVAVVLAVTGAVGLVLAVTLVACGGGATGAAYLGLGMAGLASTFTGSAAVASQLFDVRRRAAGAAAGAVGLAFLLRMLANSADATGWLRWFTPFGWLDELQSYGQPRWIALVPLVLAPVILATAAVVLRGRRDVGAALLADGDRHRAHQRLLGSPVAFAWRSTRGVFLAWVAGLGAYALMIGSLLKTVTDFMARDASYRKMLTTLGLDVSDTQDSFLGLMAVMLGLIIALYACWRIGAARAEEAAGRLDGVLAQPVARWRWLGGHLLLTLVGVTVLSAATGGLMWIGAAITGAHLGVGGSFAAAANPLSMVVLFTGLALLTFAALPRLTIALPASVAVVSMLVQLLGPGLHWPAALLDLSPFHYLAYVPAESFRVLPAVVMAGLGILWMLAGTAIFQRRDIAGA